MGADVDTDGDGIPELEPDEEQSLLYELGEEPMATSFDEGFTQAMLNNLKLIVEAAKETQENQAKQKHGFQDQLNQFALEVARDNHTLVQRTADFNAALLGRHAENAALVATRAANNDAAVDLLIKAGELDSTAQGVAGMKLSESFQDAAQKAIESAIAAVPGTSAASQGTVGVAQGAIQTQVPVELAQVLTASVNVQTALLTTLAEMTKALAAITVRVTGEAVTIS